MGSVEQLKAKIIQLRQDSVQEKIKARQKEQQKLEKEALRKRQEQQIEDYWKVAKDIVSATFQKINDEVLGSKGKIVEWRKGTAVYSYYEDVGPIGESHQEGRSIEYTIEIARLAVPEIGQVWFHRKVPSSEHLYWGRTENEAQTENELNPDTIPFKFKESGVAFELKTGLSVFSTPEEIQVEVEKLCLIEIRDLYRYSRF